jgi:hypothetical protein
MGGNAMKHVGVTRKTTTEYFAIVGDVLSKLHDAFPTCLANPIEAYSSKESFGDADILIESDNLPPNWIDIIRAVFKPQDLLNNDVVSFDYRGMQIDLIKAPRIDFFFAQVYFAFNDLGNLMGRIAHKMGFKYGHNGLWKILRDGTHAYAEVLVSRDVSAVFKFLGYDFSRHIKGFETLEDVFEYAASSPYFHRQIFKLDNRNHISRIRDIKRPTYTAFLKWIEDKPELDKYKWSAYVQDKVSVKREEEKNYWLLCATNPAIFPGFAEQLTLEYAKHKQQKVIKTKWNGFIIGSISGFVGKELGQFMEFCKSRSPVGFSFTDWIIQEQTTQEHIEKFITDCKYLWEADKGK